MSISHLDTGYLSLKAKGERRVQCGANLIVQLMDCVFERDEQIADLTRMLEALSAPLPELSGNPGTLNGEVVAWRYRLIGTAGWVHAGEDSARSVAACIDRPSMYEVQALGVLAAPLPAPPVPDKVGDGDFEGLEEMLTAAEYRALLDISDIVDGTAACPVGSPEWCALTIDLIERQAMELAAPPHATGEGS